MITEMTIAEILTLPSIDSSSTHLANIETAAQVVLTKDTESDYYGVIRDEMQHDGYNRIPLHVDYAERLMPFYSCHCPDELMYTLMMGNGHHRLALMIELVHSRTGDR